MGVDVLLGFYEPKAYTAAAALAAGTVVKVTANDTVGATTSSSDVPAGIVLIDAASGANVVVVHGCWLKSSGGGLTAGPVTAATGGALAAYSSTDPGSGNALQHPCGFARNTTDYFIF